MIPWKKTCKHVYSGTTILVVYQNDNILVKKCLSGGENVIQVPKC